MRKFLRRRAELEARLENSNVHILMLQETWLSDNVESISVPGFHLVGRMDRVLGPKQGYGGIAVFARDSLANIALLEYVDGVERMWCVLHTHVGPLLLGNWYRPPDEPGDSMDTLVEEIQRLRSDCIGVILIGDINIHHKKWLKHSRDNTALGERLWSICRETGLKQCVRDPTRKNHLLDLVMSDVSEWLKVQVLPEISDHRVVSIDVDVAVSMTPEIVRDVWDFAKADWQSLKHELSAVNWAALLVNDEVSGSVLHFCDELERICRKHIPSKQIKTCSSSHPWLDDECFAAIAAKCEASGTPEYEAKESECSRILTAAFLRHQNELRERILALPKSSKDWWRLNKELLHRRSKPSTIPPLKAGKDWVLDPTQKADLLAQTFKSKSTLPNADPDKPVDDCPLHGSPQMSGFMVIRSRTVLKILRKLKLDKASGPDGMPVRIFTECCRELAPAIAVLTRFLLRTRQWPDIWRVHRIHPLYKKGSVSNASNYRGVHLTNVLSKVVERVIGKLLTPYLDRSGAFGIDQWAFRSKRSCRDLVTLLVCRWLWALDNGFKIAIYLSDISGAFDKVDREILMKRLKDAGLSSGMLEFLHSYLAPREAVVVVQGQESLRFIISNEVFQGTVLGPPLWNVFFRPIDGPIHSCKFKAAKFADDLTAYRNFESKTANEHINEELREYQTCFLFLYTTILEQQPIYIVRRLLPNILKTHDEGTTHRHRREDAGRTRRERHRNTTLNPIPYRH